VLVTQSPTLGLSAPPPGRRHPRLPPAANEEVLAHGRREMSYMRGDLLTKTWKLVKGLAKPAPTWLKAMEEPVFSYPTPASPCP